MNIDDIFSKIGIVLVMLFVLGVVVYQSLYIKDLEQRIGNMQVDEQVCKVDYRNIITYCEKEFEKMGC